MFDLIVRANKTVLVLCQSEEEQNAVILDCVENGFDWQPPERSDDVVGLDEFDADVWLAV